MISVFPLGLNQVSLIYQSGEIYSTSQFTGLRSGVAFARAEHWSGELTFSNTNDAAKIRAYGALRAKQNPVFKLKIPNPFPGDPAHDLFPTITATSLGVAAGYREIWLTIDEDRLTQFLVDNATSEHVRERAYYETRMQNLTGHYLEFSEEGRLFQIGEKTSQETNRQKYLISPGARVLDSIAPGVGDQASVRIDTPTLVCAPLEALPYSYGQSGMFEAATIGITEHIVR